MARIFTGPVEISEIPTPNHDPLFVGNMLRFDFQCTKITADPNSGNFPIVKIGTGRVQTFQEWQQHEVQLNSFLIGTIDRVGAGPHEFEFPFQPRVLRLDRDQRRPFELPLELINTLSIMIGKGGFGLNDSFDVEYIDFVGFVTSLA